MPQAAGLLPAAPPPRAGRGGSACGRPAASGPPPGEWEPAARSAASPMEQPSWPVVPSLPWPHRGVRPPAQSSTGPRVIFVL